MPSLLVTLVLLVVGLALTVAGYLFFEEAITVIGFLFGLSIGLAALGNPDIPGQWDLVVLVAAPLVGMVLAITIELLLVAIVGGAIGFGVGVLVTGVSPADPVSLFDPAGAVLVGCLLLGAVGAFFLKTPIFMVASAGWGSTLLCFALGIDAFATGVALQSGGLVPTVPNLAFNLVGIVTQAGLWYYLHQTLDDDETVRGILARRAGRRYGSLRG